MDEYRGSLGAKGEQWRREKLIDNILGSVIMKHLYDVQQGEGVADF